MKFSHTLKTTATPAQIWLVWTDVAHWAEWDTELRDACLEGRLELGSIGQLTPKTGRLAKFKISQFSPGESYTFTIKLPLASLNVRRYLNVQADDVYFTHEVSFRGILAFVFGFLLGRKFRSVLPSVMENVKRIAELPD
jgi:Polyketide cyclase / dehydrase and lipid transport